MSRWDRGAHVVVRGRPDGAVGYTFPGIVLLDLPNAIALFQPPRTICKRRSGPRGGPRGRILLDWDGRYEDIVVEPSSVHAHRPGDGFWVIRRWDGKRYVGWYVNLSSPWRRTALGFDMNDHVLDLGVADDLSDWWWKDEDELEWAVGSGRYSAKEADAIRRHAREAVARMRERAFPFHEDWTDLCPQPTRARPVVPPGWDQVDLGAMTLPSSLE
jgi:Protein of unknown function (DUF402)